MPSPYIHTFDLQSLHPARRNSTIVAALFLCAAPPLTLPALACQPPRQGQYIPTQSEQTYRRIRLADSIVVARATSRGDNGEANPTAFQGRGWATVNVKHQFKGSPPSRVTYMLGKCGYDDSWNQHIPLDRDTLIFLVNGYVGYGLVLEPSGDPVQQARRILEHAESTPYPHPGK